MRLFSWLFPKARTTPPLRPVRRLSVERLEDRIVPALGVDLAFAWGGSLSDFATQIAHDGDGNLYVAGSFRGTVDFDPGPGELFKTSAGAEDDFIAKYSRTGAVQWVQQLGKAEPFGSSDLVVTGMAVDGAGRVYATGVFQGTTSIGGVALTSEGYSDAFVTRLDADGTVAWARRYGTSNDYSPNYTAEEVGRDLALDGAGNIYTTGRLIELTPYGSRSILYVNRYDADGNLNLDVRWAGSGIDVADLALDAAANIYLTGSYWGTADFDPGAGSYKLTVTKTTNGNIAGYPDAFVLKLTSAAGFVWAGSMGGQGADAGASIAVDATGNVYVAGRFEPDSRNDFDPGKSRVTLPNAGGSDIFLVKFDSSRKLLWARSMGGVNGEAPSAVALDALGNVFVVGGLTGTVNFNPGVSLTSAGKSDIFLVQLNSAGNYVWAGRMGGANDDSGRDLAIDGSGNLYLVGGFVGPADFDPGLGTYLLDSVPGSNPNGQPAPDAFVMCLTPGSL